VGRFRVDGSTSPIVTSNSDPIDKFFEYCAIIIDGNNALNDEVEEYYNDGEAGVIDIEDDSDKAIFSLLIIAMFDIEIENGGIAQFYTNQHLYAKDLEGALVLFNLPEIARHYREIHQVVLVNWSLLEKYWEAGRVEGTAIYDEDSPERKRRHQAWIAFREAIEPATDAFESLYYSDYGNKHGCGEGAPGPYKRAIAEACCAFIERQPELFQTITSH
jgi:hypothetical protein